ncbi:hypothetical protein TRFO_36633 [Tritrichomonas foetus]|uniref:Uncharacterized protein n=1 Tax=Tritrichomonas foetus TaxID=1144522 RepID=A0A1J4JI35_9EUKA|nr:hypothetical protein TRFO_36633 [Tritrichomonas foetus]|eukprot:OHS97181.1 hypothetical protein TRFO_36633 [Tritrichomonas foetus]
MTTDNRFFPKETWSFSKSETPIYHLGFSPNGQEISLSQWNGSVKIISAFTGRTSHTIHFESKKNIVSTSKFHPSEANVILMASPSGKIGLSRYSENNTDMIWQIQENNEIYAADFDLGGDIFVTAGKDRVVRIYNTETHKELTTMSWSDPLTDHAHASRVYSVIFDKKDSNIVYSAGWDSRVIKWDIRTAQASMVFGGPFICGDSLDLKDDMLLTGSWRTNKPLELWDTKTGDKISSADWGSDAECKVYTARFFKTTSGVVAGGAECNCIKTFKLPGWNEGQRIGMFNEAVTTLDVSPSGSMVAAATQGGFVCAFTKQF